jgi:hypothetical protein
MPILSHTALKKEKKDFNRRKKTKTKTKKRKEI